MLAPPPSITISCPHCRHNLAKIGVNSRSVISVTCVKCSYVWCADMDAMTNAQRRQAQIAILDRDRRDFASH